LIALIPVAAAALASESPLASFLGGPRAATPVATIEVTLGGTPTTPLAAATSQAVAAPPDATPASDAGAAAASSTSASNNSAVAAATPSSRTATTSSASGTTSSGSTAAPPVTTAVVATAPAPAAAPSGTGPFVAYRVKPGDTVRFVAQMYGVSPASVANASGLQNPDRLQVGQVLTVPSQSGWLYRVQPGETLAQISSRTGVSSDTIATVSHLAEATVRAGDIVLIPDLRSTGK
jgi:LysM repeat protein